MGKEVWEMSKLMIAFSGGETSAYMTNLILKTPKYRKKYPEIEIVFANTGQENEETLEFVQQCSEHFNFPVTWIESVVHHGKKKANTHRIVDFTTANRDGAVYEDTIKKYGIPNQAFPTCTRDLKLAPMRSFLRSIGWKAGQYDTVLGIRADEPSRRSKDAVANQIFYPLLDEYPTTKPDINTWWHEQPFRLNLYGYQGNCKWCWKKSSRKLLAIMDENPEFFEFPARMEKKYPLVGPEFRLHPDTLKPGHTRTFFRGNRSTKDLRAALKMGDAVFTKEEDDAIVLSDGTIIELDVENEDGSGCTESCEIDFSEKLEEDDDE